ncbi:28348_t:CDS:2 [Dentiscutata erythropus]|uniref:28348_t:CDS:1 n=1 Tax=Dentiscutata erythropus TaxID=1348616 RepID=A0A9N9GW90_9GLOM|nr:28348_t:CDS:2 [Dentiscutata erythropus]
MITESDLKDLGLNYYDISQFKNIKRIGGGAFADVYHAELINSNLKHVALKIFSQVEVSEASRKAILKEDDPKKRPTIDKVVDELR